VRYDRASVVDNKMNSRVRQWMTGAGQGRAATTNDKGARKCFRT
jgi:hypothetical protein